jgi:hypothetical protein
LGEVSFNFTTAIFSFPPHKAISPLKFHPIFPLHYVELKSKVDSSEIELSPFKLYLFNNPFANRIKNLSFFIGLNDAPSII